MIVMSSSNITITVRGEQAVKPINYSNPALGNSTDCSGVDNYKDNDRENVIPKGLPPKPFQNHCPRSLASLKTVKKNLSSGLPASRSWLIVMSFQVSVPPQAPPTHPKSLRYDFRITMVRQLEMKRRKEEIILRKKL